MDDSHKELEKIKINITIDGDLAATILNVFVWMYAHGFLEEEENIIYCGHTIPKLEKLLEQLEDRVDPDNNF